MNAEPYTLYVFWISCFSGKMQAYLPYLHANATAWRAGQKRFDFSLQGAHYRNLPVVQYRVWCRERLQQHYTALPEEARAPVDDLLNAAGALQPLLADGEIASGLYAGTTPPLCRPRKVGAMDRLHHFFAGTHWQIPGATRAP